MLLVKFVIYFLCIARSLSSNFTQLESLYDRLLSDYNKDIRPLIAPEFPVDVNVSFFPVGIKELDEMTGKFSVVGTFSITWYDLRLTWDVSVYKNFLSVEIPEKKVWKPGLMVVSPFERFASLGMGNLPITYLYNGTALWLPVEVISGTCAVDVANYPFDIQFCPIELMCWGSPSSAIRIKAPDPTINMNYFNRHGTWDVIHAALSTHLNGDLSYISIDLKLKRRPAFAIMNIVIPMKLLEILYVLVFFVPIESGERLSYSITVLLSIAVFLTIVGDNLPKTSSPISILSYFVLSDLITGSFVCFTVIFGLSAYYKDPAEERVPRILARIIRQCGRRQTARKIHRVSNYENTMSTNDGTENVKHVDVTWKMVSRTIDRLMLMLCSLYIVVTLFLFLILTTGK
ncbi:neuronal acetylcholine receptor subunit alpha-6-like [Saccostrea cucullata]|uniref:neuronal acetylcholine receptor subunit alpha-6-like n=1 Tax=Saccostrea cuccullata TaxID=36930 RepID=UPI002ED2DABF